MAKRWVATVLALMALLLCACTEEQVDTQPQPTRETVTEPTEITVVEQPTVGICLPREDAFFKTQAEALRRHLEDIGYDTIVQFAAGDYKVQKNQLSDMVLRKVDAVIVTPVDSYALVEEIRQLADAGILTVAYDRMAAYAPEVDLCVQPDHQAMGKALAQYIVSTQLPDQSQKKTIEFLMGAPDNESALLFYRGAMEVLQPLLDSGTLICRSGRTGFEDVAVLGETVQAAFQQCYDYMDEYYEKDVPDILFCGADTLAEGCVYAMEHFPKQLEKGYPVIASAGGSLKTVALIGEGKQDVSLYVDRNEQALQCAKLTYRLLSGQSLPDMDRRSNGAREIPCCYIASQVIHRDNDRQQLVDTGTYSQLQLDEALRPENRPAVSVPTATRPGTLPPPPNRPPVPTTPGTTTAPTTGATTPTQTQPPETQPTEPTTPPTTAPTAPPTLPSNIPSLTLPSGG